MLRNVGLASFACPVRVFVLPFGLIAQASASTVIKIPAGTMARLAREEGAD
jgi:hypothetical protein